MDTEMQKEMLLPVSRKELPCLYMQKAQDDSKRKYFVG
jgi:hypothetical protein